MVKRIAQLREELGIINHGKTPTSNSVLVHLAFRLDVPTAEQFIRVAASEGISESLWARKAVIAMLKRQHVHKREEK